jgi:hypothetical protein
LISGAARVAGLAMIGTVHGEIPVDSADDERLLAMPSSTYRRFEQLVCRGFPDTEIVCDDQTTNTVAVGGQAVWGQVSR